MVDGFYQNRIFGRRNMDIFEWEPCIEGENITGLMREGVCQDVPAIPVTILDIAQKLFELKNPFNWELAA